MSDVASMEAGPELDRVIAERVIGLMTRENDDGVSAGWVPDESGGGRYIMLPAYSTDIADAWEIVELLRGRGLVPVVYPVAGGWCCLVVKDGPCVCIGMIDVDTLGPEGCGFGASAPLAICRAALSALEHP